MDWIKALPSLLIAVLAVALAFMINQYMNERDLRVKAETTLVKERENAENLLKLQAEGYNNTYGQLRREYEGKVNSARDGAVAAYCMHNPTLCKPPVSCSSSVNVDDGTQPTRVYVDDEFLKNVTETVGKLKAFQEMCIRNNCTVKEGHE